MNTSLHLRLMLGAMRKSGFRALMAIISVGLACGSIMVALALSTGASREVQAVSDMVGKNVFVVKPARTQALPGRTSGWFMATSLNESDVELLRRSIGGITVVPISEGALRVKFGRTSHPTTLRGVGLDYFRVRNFKLDQGRLLAKADEVAGDRVAVVGFDVAKKLGGAAGLMGAEIHVGGIPFLVVGTLEQKGLSVGGNEDDQIVIPLSTALHRVFNTDHLDSLVVQVNDQARLDSAISVARDSLRDAHGTGVNQKDDFEILMLIKAQEIRTRNSKVLQGLSKIFALITLMTGGAGVFAVTYLNVIDRTPEIGLRMAVGARRKNIAVLFIAEATVLSLLGGVLGIVLGGLGILLLGYFTDWSMSIDAGDVVMPFVISALLGLLTGLFPAIKASKLVPVEALRSA